MTDQLALLDEPPRLTARQQACVDYLAAHDGVPADEVGALLHERRGKHLAGERCEWCHTEGRSVLRAKAVRGLVTFRKGPERLYLLRDPARRTPAVTGVDPRTSEIPF